MDFTLSQRCTQWREAIRCFINEVVIPREAAISPGGVDDAPEQKQRYMRPLVAGEVRSCFAMTEPAPGAGSDPAALRTTASSTASGWVVNGRKHLVTGADGAALAIVMAASPEAGSATMFLVDTSTKGSTITGHAQTIGTTMTGGHCEVSLEEVHVRQDGVLGEPGCGSAYAQVRLAPARLTHCMRWLGAARRAHEVASARSVQREVFRRPLTEHGLAQQMLADNETELAVARALLGQTCQEIVRGDRGNEASSRAKVFISEATSRIVDRSVQLCGGLGTSEEMAVGRIHADIRAFRIYDGASEVHRISIGKRVARRVRAELATAQA